MHQLTIGHFLQIYKTRQEMQDLGITSPPEEIKIFTKNLVETLLKYPQDEKISFLDMKLIDAKNKLIVDFKTKTFL